LVADPSLRSKYWLVRKVVAVVGYYGGFRNIELKALKFGFVMDGDNNPTAEKVLEKSADGSYWIQFYRSKQRKSQVLTQICVPKCSEEMVACNDSVDRVSIGICPASVIDQYLNVLSTDLKCSVDELEGDFFKSTHGSEGKKFVRVPLGKNKLALVGTEFARELMLPNSHLYTGHCWRRSCSTNSSNAGVNVTSLMAHMGWSDPKTAIRYVAKSKQSAHQMALYLCNAQRSNMKDVDLFQIPKVAPLLNFGTLPRRMKIVEESVSKSSVMSLGLVSDSPSSVLSDGCESSSKDFGCESSTKAPSDCVSSSILSLANCNEDPKHGVGSKVGVESGFLDAIGAAGECLKVMPASRVNNESIERSVESQLSGWVGSIINSGTINFNIQFVTK
jgi:hypothetical protein